MSLKIHVYPLDDLQEHDTEGDSCSCNPTIEEHLIVHNSWDERESYEEGRKPS